MSRLLVAAFVVLASVSGSPLSAQQRGLPQGPLPPGQTNDPFPQPIAARRGRHPRHASRVRIAPGHRRRCRAHDDARRGAGHAAPVRQRHARPAVYRERGWQDGDAVPRCQRSEVGRRRSSRKAASAGCRASCSIHSSPSPARRGFGKLYAYTDTSNQTPAPDFTTPNEKSTHDTVLLEWTAKTPTAAAYDGEAPRELIRLRQPFANHNGGAITFNSTARPGAADFGLLYMGIGDGGSGGDPMNLAQNLGSAFGKIFRIDPLGKNGRGGKYGIPGGEPVRVEGRTPCRRSLRMASAMRSASPGIRRAARCSCPTSARTSSRKSVR